MEDTALIGQATSVQIRDVALLCLRAAALEVEMIVCDANIISLQFADPAQMVFDINGGIAQAEVAAISNVLQGYFAETGIDVSGVVPEHLEQLRDMPENYPKTSKVPEPLEDEMEEGMRQLRITERETLARSLLSVLWIPFGVKPDEASLPPMETITRSQIVQYFEVCCAAVRIPEVKDYLKGESLNIHRQSQDRTEGKKKTRNESFDPTSGMRFLEERLIYLEKVLLGGILGYPIADPTIAVSRAKQILHALTLVGQQDAKLQELFDYFVLSMRLAYCAVWEPGRENY